jgi:sporulation protein YlmC with PRC-barrel domain
MTHSEHDTGPGPALMGAATLIGEGVVNRHSDSLGNIKDIMLDMGTGRVAYAVLSYHGFLHTGDKLFAVPWHALHLDTVNKRFVLNVDKATLKHAPGFNKDAWPDMADIEWANSIHSFYGVDPVSTAAPATPPGASLDPRPGVGRVGDDADLSRIRGSNIG